MTAAALRKELQSHIETMPERSLRVLRPLILALDEPRYTVEPASADEITMIDEAMKEYERDPAAFTGWETVKKEIGLV